MWQIVDQTPFSADGTFVRDGSGFEHWVVALRATFRINDNGFVSIDEDQKPVCRSSVYAERDGEADHEELRVDTDFSPFRPKVDVTIGGQVVAPNGKPFQEQPFEVSIGSFKKPGVAFAPREMKHASRGWQVEANEQTEAVELSWRNAIGGKDAFGGSETHPTNPIGKGWFASKQSISRDMQLELPQIEDPANRFKQIDKIPTPVGFGAVARAWSPRRERAGTYDDEWEEDRAPLAPLDFSDRFHQAAPDDQVLDLRGGERVSIIGLHPEGPYEFVLPQIILEAQTHINRRKPIQRLRLIAVHIDASGKRLSMVWNTSLPCNGLEQVLDRSTVWVKQMAGVAK
ncbi:DUF2169 domain-containing protein [Rhizobium sp. P38BS-XIX]|uniref:DUF2169 family type VI secretion system accessory protein n=1 Tax=Rhizobium sp. P38BS-XIX TaxID=2726740 RepID=UPI001456F0C9|nr:DUF2169 domain-containing protein [Rhizobium sp. P38BS-XIX]NLS00073.1 DUF2169 domain-containing protein [Rhizobium sp. P38BS-XIX]